MKVIISILLPALLAAQRLTTTSFAPEIKRVYSAPKQSNKLSASSFQGDKKITKENQQEITKQAFEKLKVEYQITAQFETKHKGWLHSHAVQIVNGVPVANSAMGVTVNSEGKIIAEYNAVWEGQAEEIDEAQEDQIVFNAASFGKQTAPTPVREHKISAEEALARLAESIGIKVSAKRFKTETKHSLRSEEPVIVISEVPFTVDKKVHAKKAYIASPDYANGLALVWDLEVEMSENWFHAHIDAATGKVLSRIDWHADAGYNVFPPGTNDPSEHPQVWVDEPAHLESSPLGWHATSTRKYTTTKGNNVVAIENLAGSYFPRTKEGSVSGGKDLIFNNTYDLTNDPKASIDAAVTQLFVTCNWIHDVFYKYGFDEVSGNFQDDNFGKGGRGGDSVIAQAQDGSGTNNANFATPPDGRHGKMRMYVWTGTHPNRDGDLEAGIVIHEYAHGISTRLTGGPMNSNCLSYGESGGMGEGWGDIFATILRMKGHETRDTAFGMGNWANAGKGIRPYDYSTDMTVNPHTYGHLNKAAYFGVHAKGAVWATILYDLYWVFMEGETWSGDWYTPESGGNTKFMQVVVDGLKLQPCMPTFLDARDAILTAERENYGGKLQCAMWKAFANRGLGYEAKAGRRVVEDFTVPSEC